MPSILYGAGRRRLLGLALGLSLALLLGIIAACGPAKSGQASAPRAPRAGDPAGRVRVFLISPGDQGHAGKKVACGDSAVPVEIALSPKAPALEGALRSLLAIKEQYHEPSGLYNALYASTLELVRIERQGQDARVYLQGYLERSGECDNPRILAELQETALQFPDVTRVQFFLEDQPLQQILAGQG